MTIILGVDFRQVLFVVMKESRHNVRGSKEHISLNIKDKIFNFFNGEPKSLTF